MNNIVVTNLRIPESDLSLVRTVARDLGLSANEYINKAINRAVVTDHLADPGKKRRSIYDALMELSKIKYKKSFKDELSDDDKAIYDT